MGGGAAEVPVVDQERSCQAQQRLDRQECDLSTRGDRGSSYEFAELLPSLTEGQIQEIGKFRHTARLLLVSLDEKTTYGSRPYGSMP